MRKRQLIYNLSDVNNLEVPFNIGCDRNDMNTRRQFLQTLGLSVMATGLRGYAADPSAATDASNTRATHEKAFVVSAKYLVLPIHNTDAKNTKGKSKVNPL